MKKVRIMKKIGFIALTSASIFVASSLFSCNHQGLGKRVDTSIPTVAITNLASKQSVGEQFDIEGNAKDDFGIERVELVLRDKDEKVVNKWVFKNGSCSTLSGSLPGTSFTWSGTESNRTWSLIDVSLPPNANGEASGEYKLNAYAFDTSGYGSATLADSQKSLIYDKEPPVVTVSKPAKRYKSKTAIKTALDGETSYQKYTMLENYTNSDFTISGTIRENFSLKYLKVWIKDERGLVIWKSNVLLAKDEARYKESFEKDATKLNVFDDGGKEDKFEVVSSLRSWSVDIPDLSKMNPETKSPNTLNGGLITNKKYLQIITMSSDDAGNIEEKADPDAAGYVEPDPADPASDTNDKVQIVNQGWFCYWPESDIPWFVITLGDTEATAYACYPGTNLQGYSYDDDGIAEVVAVRENLATGEKVLVEIYSATADESATYQTWSLEAPKNDGTYKYEITVTDIRGNKSEPKVGYLAVKDINSPYVKVIAPPQTETLFGDTNGDVVFNLEADDDSGVSKLACVYLKEESDAARYLNPGYANWASVSSSKETAVDSNKNMLWNIPLKSAGTVSSAGNTRQKYTGELKLNLFKTLGIDGKDIKLGGQHFIFYVSDNGGNAVCLDYAIQGDIEAPTVSFDEITIGTAKYTIKDGALYEGTEKREVLSDLPSGTAITLKGTWNDDSMKAWGNSISKLSKFAILWTTSNDPIELNKLSTFKTTYNAAKDVNEWSVSLNYGGNYIGTAIALSAELSDYAGNTKVAKASFMVNTQAPAFNSITANNSDGYYGKDEELEIVMKFNKPIYVSGTTANLSLTLDNGGTATFDAASSGTANLVFKYTTEQGKDTTDLDVKKINQTGVVFSDGDNGTGTKLVPDLTTIPGKNLADNKEIQIVTTSPIWNSTELSEDGSLLTLTFSADVSKNLGDLTITQTDATLTKVPAVLSESEFRKWNNADSSTNLLNYYTKGTNGATKNGAADLETKYVLNYNLSSNNATLLASYKKANLHKVTMSVKSSKVKATKTKLEITLDGSYALPCKGASYSVDIPAGFVTNIVGTENPRPAAAKTVKYLGVENPVIRVNKAKWELNTSTLTAKQPLQSHAKIDCETTGAVVTYGTAEQNFPYTAAAAKTRLEAGGKEAPYPTAGGVNTDVTSFKNYSSEISLGSTDWKNAQKIFIQAKTTPPSGYGSGEVSSYEMAYRSVFVFDEQDGGYGGGGEGRILVKDLGDDGRVWLRGGDAETGPVTTAGFPLSWDDSDFKTGSCGAALLTKDGTDTFGKWYYVTWEITTTAYVGVLAGTVDAESGTKGPAEWTNGMNAWVPFKKWYCLFPGESRIVEAQEYGWVLGQERGTFGFKKETIDREGNEKSYGTSGSGGGGGGGGSSNPTHTPDNSPVSTADAALPGQMLETFIDLSDGDGWVQLPTISLENNANLNKNDFIAEVASEGNGWQNVYKTSTMTIKTNSTFDQEVNAFIQILDAWWGAILPAATDITGATIQEGKNLYPDPLDDGTITITFSSDQTKILFERGMQLNGYGVKLTSMTIVPNP